MIIHVLCVYFPVGHPRINEFARSEVCSLVFLCIFIMSVAVFCVVGRINRLHLFSFHGRCWPQLDQTDHAWDRSTSYDVFLLLLHYLPFLKRISNRHRLLKQNLYNCI